ncbi:hypothetical protein UFOVP589_49 [uncultured Caudovirales phage]|uniref:Uncharacterized protein n=1 Tax=uncultured Caudovirales phage TaxID=2100421 RepID=A0A6J5N3U5_9CAUD|nr:hypothetical protein UFOVP589_49 [uncultured Caudovirales phage]
MIYQMDELRKLIAPDKIADVAREIGINYSTAWRIFRGTQEPKESTLIGLTKYVEYHK